MNIKKLNQNGFSHILLGVLIVIVIAAIAVVGVEVTKNHKPSNTTNTSNSSSNSTSSTSSSTDASCLVAYHDTNLCKFAANSADFEKTAYTATLDVTQSGSTGAMTLKNDGKGNTELNTTSDGETINAITLNGNTYIQTNGAGSWIEYPSGSSAPTSNPTSNLNIGVDASGITYKSLGTTSCGSLTCYKYQVTDSSQSGATQYAYFDTSSYKLREWQYSDGSGNSTTMTITYTSVTISAPSPVESYTSAE